MRKIVIHFITILPAWLWLSAVIGFVVYASCSVAPTLAIPLTQDGSGHQADQTPVTATQSTLDHFVYLPLVTTASAAKMYWGALVDGQAPSTTHMQPGGLFDTFETRVQKQLSILHWGQPWKMNNTYQGFYAPWFDNVRSHGSIPLLDWGSWHLTYGVDQPDFKLSTIYNGTHDAYLTQWALDAKAWGHPFFLRFDWEMNGNWQFPWSEQLNGNQPGDYVKAWRHVHDIFTHNGVTNVTWVWCPNISSSTTRGMALLYPGDAYVDWTCLDGYNKYPMWLSFNTIFTASGIDWLNNSYAEILAVAPTKPIMLGEFASREDGDGGPRKAAWIKDALEVQLPTKFPMIKAVVWFNWNAGDSANTFPLESSPHSLDAFAAAIKSSYYAANDFANLNTSPIPPLP